MINVDELEDLLAKATPGPLQALKYAESDNWCVSQVAPPEGQDFAFVPASRVHTEADARLFVALRNNADALLSLLRHQQEEIEAIRSLLGKAHASASGPCNEGFRVSVYFHTPEAAQALHAALPLPGEG